MSGDEPIYEPIWKLPLEDFDGIKPKPPPRNGSVRTNYSESEDGLSESYKSFEGESIDNLDVCTNRLSTSQSNRIQRIAKSVKQDMIPFPKKPCFSEIDDSDKLEYHGPIIQIVQKITTSKKARYAVLVSNRLILFEKPEHKVSKIQIPLISMIGIDWYDNANCANKDDCNKFRLETPVKSYKFQCSSHENAGLWINHIGKLIYQKPNVDEEPQSYILKATVSLESVREKRIFTIEPKFTIAYYESEEDYKYGIAMHRIQLRSSGVKRDSDVNTFTLITSYRKYKLTFETSAICNEWFQALSVIIQKAISSTICSTTAKSGDDLLKDLTENKSNKLCAECKSTEIEWASINLFITLCSKCSGLHRGLGPNISKIQGIFTDEFRWEDKNLIKLFQIIGNDNANRFWMANYVEDRSEVSHKFLCDKYIKKKYIEKKESIFEKYKDLVLLNEELLLSVQKDDLIRIMKVFHIGASLDYIYSSNGMNILIFAEKHNYKLQFTYLNNQCKSQVKDWRNDLFDPYDSMTEEETPFQERHLLCSINLCSIAEEKVVLIWNNCIQILENNVYKKEICKIFFQNICLVREKKIASDKISLVITTRETEYSYQSSNSDKAINIVEFFEETYQSNDLKDFKNVIGQNMYSKFTPASSYVCIAWVIVSTVSEDWEPCLLFLNYNSVIEFYDPKDIYHSHLTLDLRKVYKIEEIRENNYENICPFKMYNLASIHLMSAAIYHIRGDTKETYEEISKAFMESWDVTDPGSLSNQFLTQNNVPLAVDKMIKYLQIHGTQIEGLFRRVGSVKEAEKIYNQLITNPNSYVLTNCEPHDVASALKLFFRKLEDPLLTSQLYENWLFAIDIDNSEDKFCYYKNIISSLPLINYQTLRLLIFLLVNIDKNNDVTQMNPDNLGTSFNTCLLTGSNTGDFNHRNLQILPYLIRNYQDLFDVTQEELLLEKMYNKERKKINDSQPSETSLLRQIYIHSELECFLKRNINFETESENKKSSTSTMCLSKQLRIEQSMTSKSLVNKLFEEELIINENIMIFEERKIDDLRMHHLIYPNENLVQVIQNSENSDTKVTSHKKWIFKKNCSRIVSKLNNSSFKCWASLSVSNRNKVYIELSETHQINIWKNDQCMELLLNIPIKGIVLFRSYEKDKYIIAFEDRRYQSNSLPSLFQIFSFKSRSFNFINFCNKSEYFTFLEFFDHAKLTEMLR